MFSYAAKRIERGRSVFIALFLSVALAAALFSGILQGADATSVSMLNKALKASDVDIVSGAENRNLTKTAFREVEEAIGGVEHVEKVDHIVRLNMDVSNLTDTNKTIPFTVVVIGDGSSLLAGISGVKELETGKVYIDRGSDNATRFQPGDTVTLKIMTYNPYGSILDIWPMYYNRTVGGFIDLDDRVFSIAMGRYPLFIRAVLLSTGESEQRPPHQLMIMNEETLWGILNSIYEEKRNPTAALVPEIIIGLDRGALVTPWDMAGSERAVRLVDEEINAIGARYGYVPVNYLGLLLQSLEGNSSSMKTSTLLVAAPVFFTAWYLGMTVSDVSLGMRRREIGLLFTRGLTHRQVFYIFTFEALLISLLAGAVGVITGAALLSLIIPGLDASQILGSMSPVTVVASFLFSGVLALLVIYRPAKNATKIDIVEALREYRSEEEAPVGSWQEPLLALALGGYKVTMLLLGLRVEFFSPTTDNVVVSLLYSMWWGVDYILTFIAPILFFWGFTKLFIQYSSAFHSLIGRLAGALAGDVTIFSTIGTRRSAKRVVASTFMVALVFGYAVSVIGSVASSDDFTDRSLKMAVGADASVWLTPGQGGQKMPWSEARDLNLWAKGIASKIEAMEGVSGATVEMWFDAQSSLGTIEVRIIDPMKWKDVAYMEPGWLQGADAFQRMNGSDKAIIMERGAVERLGFEVNGTMLIKMGTDTYSLTIVGIFGREPPMEWSPQAPTIYVSEAFADNLHDYDVKETRILVKLKNGVPREGLASEIEALDPNVGAVDVTEEHLRLINSNVLLVGPRRVEEMGVYMAALVSSIGVALVVSTMLRSRWKELTIMAIRGFSQRQLLTSLLVENMALVSFALLLGFAVGFISLRGEVGIFNSLVSSSLERRILFTPYVQLSMVTIIGLILAATIIPILVAVRQASNKPTWSVEE